MLSSKGVNRVGEGANREGQDFYLPHPLTNVETQREVNKISPDYLLFTHVISCLIK